MRDISTTESEQEQTEEKKPLGRPSLYKEEYADELIKFFDVPALKIEILKDSKGNERAEVMAATFPTLARFAIKCGVSRDTLYEWATATLEDGSLKHPDFSYAYKRAKDFQEAILVEGAMAGAYQANFSIFTAKNVLGWRDKMEQEITGANGAPLISGVEITLVDTDGSKSTD
jgi:hypothetical protein